MAPARKLFPILAAFVLLGCESRSLVRSENPPGTLVSVQGFSNVIEGGVCEYPPGKSECVEKNVNLRDYLPYDVKVADHLTAAQSGPGYVFRIEWGHKIPEIYGRADFPVSWEVYRDDKGQEMPSQSIEAFLGRLPVTSILEAAPEEFVSPALEPGRVYVFYLVGTVYGGKTDENWFAYISTLYARIAVDLTSVK